MPVRLNVPEIHSGCEGWPDGHYVQLHGSDIAAFARDVARFVADGLALGNSIVLVATPKHRQAFLDELARISGAGADGIEQLNAVDSLERFMARGYPDAQAFDRTIGDYVRGVAAASDGKGVRIYGEMVGLLWQSGQYPAAIRLEQLWNKLRRDVPFTLYCGYPIDVFDSGFQSGMVDALLSAHTHLLPASAASSLEWAVTRAIDDVLGIAPEALESKLSENEIHARGALPRGESMILWVRRTYAEDADDVLAAARNYYYERSA